MNGNAQHSASGFDVHCSTSGAVASVVTTAVCGLLVPAAWSMWWHSIDTRACCCPGRLVLSSWAQKACGTNGFNCVPWGPYGYLSGTSMACPHVSALVAQCYRRGVCRSSNGTELARIVSLTEAYNMANRGYGFQGDPLRPMLGRYFGWLIHGNAW